MRRLRDVGEHAWLARLCARLAAEFGDGDGRILVGPGDDAAVVRAGRRPLLLTTDTLIEGVHFRRRWTTTAALGRRAFAVNASDLAAMGGWPRFALLALEAPARTPVRDLDDLVRGFAATAGRVGCRLVGGNVASGPHLAVTVALVGEAPGRVSTRAGARAGDGVYLTGTIGGTGVAVRRLRAGGAARLPHPPDRLRTGVALARIASAMIDVSDGLLQDLGHLCRASGVAAEIQLGSLPVAASCRRALGEAAPAFAAAAGEDYELLAAVPTRRAGALRRLVPRLGCRLTRIGRIVAGRPSVRVVDARGGTLRLGARGFDHFRP